MSNTSRLNEVHKITLERIERNERNYKAAFVGAAFVEALFLAGFLLLADFSNRTHVLLLLTTVATYTLLAFGLMALGAHMSRNTLRVLKAVELLRRDETA